MASRLVPRVSVTPTTPYEDLPQYLTVKDAAVYTQQCEWTIRQAIHEGKLRGSTQQFGRKRILIPKECFRVVLEPVAEAAL